MRHRTALRNDREGVFPKFFGGFYSSRYSARALPMERRLQPSPTTYVAAGKRELPSFANVSETPGNESSPSLSSSSPLLFSHSTILDFCPSEAVSRRYNYSTVSPILTPTSETPLPFLPLNLNNNLSHKTRLNGGSGR